MRFYTSIPPIFYNDSYVIGSGTYGKVSVYTKPDGSFWAVKEIKWDVDDGTLPALGEIDVLSRIKHPHLISCDEFGIDKKKGTLFFIFPFAPYTLENYLKIKVPNFKKRKELAHQLISALWWLEEQNYHHCDLKPENIVIIDDELFLIDLGLVHHRFSTETMCTSLVFSAPEGLLKSPYHKKEFTEKELEYLENHTKYGSKWNVPLRMKPLEIWSLGIVLYFIFFEVNLFNNDPLFYTASAFLFRVLEYVHDPRTTLRQYMSESLRLLQTSSDIRHHQLSQALIQFVDDYDHIILDLLDPDPDHRMYIDLKNLASIPFFNKGGPILGTLISPPLHTFHPPNQQELETTISLLNHYNEKFGYSKAVLFYSFQLFYRIYNLVLTNPPIPMIAIALVCWGMIQRILTPYTFEKKEIVNLVYGKVSSSTTYEQLFLSLEIRIIQVTNGILCPKNLYDEFVDGKLDADLAEKTLHLNKKHSEVKYLLESIKEKRLLIDNTIPSHPQYHYYSQ